MSNAEDHLPPSAAYVRDIIQREGPIRRQELLARIDLPEGTFDGAITTLKRRDLVKTKPDPRDARQIRYDIRG